VAPPPSSVTVPPPSRIVSFANVIVCVTGITIGVAPHFIAITPPVAAAARSALSVHSAGVPSPIVVVGDVTSASGGAVQVAAGTPASGARGPSPTLASPSPLPPPPHAATTPMTSATLIRPVYRRRCVTSLSQRSDLRTAFPRPTDV